MSSREVIRVKGDHHQFAHPIRLGIVTVPHPVKDLSISILRSIEKQADLKLRRR